jgi:hypothetical protein
MKKTRLPISVRSILLSAVLTMLLAIPARAVFDPATLDGRHYINIIFILDCSASMNKIIGPVRKIDIGKKTVETIIKNLAVESHQAGSMNTGLRVFGSKFYKWKKNCDDTTLEIPLADIEETMNPILGKVQTVTAKGQSSLALTMDALTGDFPDDPEQCCFIVVVSDGDESCGGNPCLAVEQLASVNQGISVNTLGVETDPAGYDNLNCMAEAGNGLYFDSKDVDEFILFLKQCNETIQNNRMNIARTNVDTNTIVQRDVTENMTEYKVDNPMALFPERDERFGTTDTIKPEDKVFMISTRGLWVEVFAPDRQLKGWVLTSRGGSQYSVTVTDDKTPLYVEKSPSSEVVTYLNAGQQLTVLKKEGAWYNVFSPNNNTFRGWVIAFNVVEN